MNDLSTAWKSGQRCPTSPLRYPDPFRLGRLNVELSARLREMTRQRDGYKRIAESEMRARHRAAMLYGEVV